MKNTIDDLRNDLFATIAGLRSSDHPMEVDRARAIADVARVIVDSAKVEVRCLELSGNANGSRFMPAGEVTSAAPTPQRQIGPGRPKFDTSNAITTQLVAALADGESYDKRELLRIVRDVVPMAEMASVEQFILARQAEIVVIHTPAGDRYKLRGKAVQS